MHSHPQTSHVSKLASALQERDRKICLDLYEHRVLTTHQITDLHFENPRVARMRLRKLYRVGVVDRFRPFRRTGSAPCHYLLGEAGAHVVAAEIGVEVKELRLRRDRLARMAFSPRLDHLLAVNTFFTRLVWACRHAPDHTVTTWLSEQRTRRRWGAIVLPDGFGRVEGPGRSLQFFLELDLGTESPARLSQKLAGYEEAARVDDAPGALLFCFPDQQREASARKALYRCGLEVATASFDRHCPDPLGRNWLPLESRQRVPLLAVRPK